MDPPDRRRRYNRLWRSTRPAMATQAIDSLPALPSCPADSTPGTAPQKRVNGEQDMAGARAHPARADLPAWESSCAYARLSLCAARLNAAVAFANTPASPAPSSDRVRKLVEVLRVLDSWIDEIPPLKTPQRFGNRAFGDWVRRLEERGPGLLESVVPSSHASALAELSFHFVGAFGSGVRIDYGCAGAVRSALTCSSGHELEFLAFLTILRLIGLLAPDDERAMVLEVFAAYLDICRRLQAVYNLEPAGRSVDVLAAPLTHAARASTASTTISTSRTSGAARNSILPPRRRRSSSTPSASSRSPRPTFSPRRSCTSTDSSAVPSASTRRCSTPSP